MSRKASNIWDNFKWLWQEGKKLGFWGILQALWEDLVKNRSLSQWLYLLALSFPTLVLEFIGGTRHIAGFAAALTGILCVIFVAEGRISNISSVLFMKCSIFISVLKICIMVKF